VVLTEGVDVEQNRKETVLSGGVAVREEGEKKSKRKEKREKTKNGWLTSHRAGSRSCIPKWVNKTRNQQDHRLRQV